MLLAIGCRAKQAEVRPIAATTLIDCPIEGRIELEALDDAAPGPASFVELSVGSAAGDLTLPESTRAFLARGRGPGGELVSLGVLSVREGRADGPIYRANTACAFRDPGGSAARFPPLLEPAIATSGSFAILAGGKDASGDARSDVVIVDGAVGVAKRLGLRRRRHEAAAAIVSDRAIVAGGQAGDLWEDAEVVDLSGPRVLPESIALGEVRAHGTAVAISSTEVLLVGGRGSRGPLRTMEILELGKATAKTIDVASLSVGRIAPLVLRMITGEILVIGGLDELGKTVVDVDVLDARASKRIATFPLAAVGTLSGVALPSGAALVVEDAGTVTRAFLIRPDGTERLPDPPRHGRARLVAGTNGAPFLFDGASSRFDPLSYTFVERSVPAQLAPDAIDPFALEGGVLGVARVEGDSMVIRALRYDLRPPLVSDPESLGLGSTDHLSSDRIGPAVVREGLVITPRARVAVTDASYRGVLIRLNSSGRDLPEIEFRSEDGAIVARIGDVTCPWPAGSAPIAEVLRERDGSIVVRVGDASRACTPLVARERVVVTLVAGTAEARVRGLTITRR